LGAARRGSLANGLATGALSQMERRRRARNRAPVRLADFATASPIAAGFSIALIRYVGVQLSFDGSRVCRLGMSLYPGSNRNWGALVVNDLLRVGCLSSARNRSCRSTQLNGNAAPARLRPGLSRIRRAAPRRRHPKPVTGIDPIECSPAGHRETEPKEEPRHHSRLSVA